MSKDFKWLLDKADGIVTLKTEFESDGKYYVVQTIEVTADSTNVYATVRDTFTAETVGEVFKKLPVVERADVDISAGDRVAEVKEVTKKKRAPKKAE